MAEALGVARHLGVEHLLGVVLGHRPGHHPAAGPLPVQDDLHVALGGLLPVGEQLFGDHSLRVGAHHHLGLPLGGVHAADLHALHVEGGPSSRYTTVWGFMIRLPVPGPSP